MPLMRDTKPVNRDASRSARAAREAAILGTSSDYAINQASHELVHPAPLPLETGISVQQLPKATVAIKRRGFPHTSKETVVPSESLTGSPVDQTIAKQLARTRDADLIELVTQIAQGDQQALAALYDTTNRLIYGLILRVLNDQGTAEEVLLDVYTQVWRQAPTYDTGRGSPLAWLTTIARSRAIDRLRSGWQTQQRSEPLDVVTDKETNAANPEENSVFAERQRIVKQALATLSPEQREVIELAYYGGLSHSEIAAKLNQPIGTVKTRTRLGMTKLRDALAPLLGEAEAMS